jgi:hypothetical protein
MEINLDLVANAQAKAMKTMESDQKDLRLWITLFLDRHI